MLKKSLKPYKPGAVTEKLYFFIAEYEDNNRQTAGGGLPEEGEDVEVLEMPFRRLSQRSKAVK